MSALILAIWNGPFPCQVPGQGTLQPGDEAYVTEEDLLSTHWIAKEQPKRLGKPGSAANPIVAVTDTPSDPAPATEVTV